MRCSLPPSVRTEHAPIDLTQTPLDFPLSGAQPHLSAGPHLPTPHVTAAHGHTPNQHRFCDCFSCPSIHRECGSQPLPPLQSSCRFPTWTSTHPPSLRHSHRLFSCQSANEANAAPPRSCAPRCSKSTGHSDNSILAHTSWHRLSFQDPRVKIARALLRILEHVLSRTV